MILVTMRNIFLVSAAIATITFVVAIAAQIMKFHLTL